MKRVVRFALLTLVLFSVGTSMASAQSVAQAAREAQMQKKTPAKKVYTNDEIGSVVIPASEKDPAPVAAPATGEAKSADNAAPEEKATDKKEDGPKKDDELKKTVAVQQAKVADIERELNLMEREHQVRVSTYYADAGNQLRDSKKWFDDEKKYNEELAGKRKDLSDAKDKLAQTMESARKAGVAVREGQ
jgi:hypothetical protein